MTPTHELIASPFSVDHLVLRPGSAAGIKLSASKFEELRAAVEVPNWLIAAAQSTWGLDLTQRPLTETVLMRERSRWAYVRATWELNLGCNFDCEHCYLGLKKFEGMSWPERERLLDILVESGVLWLQLTGGEPLIDELFVDSYTRAYDLGMMLTILSNGSRLANPRILELLTTRPPHQITLSMYGATEDSYDGLTRRRGAFRKFTAGVAAALEAGLPLKFSLIVTERNADELDLMKSFADERGIEHNSFVNMSPTIYGGPETVLTQSAGHLRKRKPFTGCNAGHTFFHVDPPRQGQHLQDRPQPEHRPARRGRRRSGSARRNRRFLAAAAGGLHWMHPQRILRHLYAPGTALPQGQIAAGHLLPASREGGERRMTAVLVEIGPRPDIEPDVVIVDDIDTLVDADKCSCSVGDDQPY